MSSENQILHCRQWLRQRTEHRNGITSIHIENLFKSSADGQVLTISSTECCYHNIQECIDYIRNAGSKTILVVTAFSHDGKSILNACESSSQLKTVYTPKPLSMSADDAQTHSKEVFIDTDHDKFFDQLCLDLSVFFDDQPKLQCFDSNNNSTMSLSSQNASFMWSKILIDALKDLSNDHDAMNDLIHIMKQSYEHNPETLKQIEDFSSTYQSQNVIHLYTDKSFFYRSLNAALRTEDINALYSFRLAIVDLCKQLEQQQRHYVPTQSNITVYRGQCMSQSELDKLKNNCNNLISMNSFWSTSFDKNVAMMFIDPRRSLSGYCTVLFHVDIDTNLKSVLFAPITEFSQFKDEDELLFGLETVFEIHQVNFDSKNNWWSVHLIATDRGNEIYEEYKAVLRKEAAADNIHIIFGCMMITMGQHRKAMEYFGKLTNRLAKDDVMLQGSYCRHYSRALYASGKYEQARVLLIEGLDMFDKNNISSENINYMALQFQLANVYMFLKKYNDALQLYQTVLDIRRKVLPPDHRNFGDSYCGLAWAYSMLSQPDKELEWTLKALDHYKNVLPPNHPAISGALKSLAGIYKSRKELDLALNHLQQALERYERYLPKDHPTIAEVLREIGDIYEAKQDLKTALDYDLRSCNMQKKNYPSGHILIASTLEVIGNIYRDLKQFDEALKYLFESIELRKQLEPPDNFISKHALGETYLVMGNSKEAIDCFEFTLQAKAIQYGIEHATTLVTKNYLAVAYSENGETARAQQLFEELLSTYARLYPTGTFRIGITLRRMGSNYLKMNKIDEARKCFEDSIPILEQHLAPDHGEVKLAKNELLKLKAYE